MDTYEKLQELIEQVCSEEGVGLTDIFDMPKRDNSNLISQFEEKYNVKLPGDYKFFLLTYGSGGMNDFDFFGIESKKDDVDSCSVAAATLGHRKKGMPEQLVVIEYDGDYVTCIDTSEDSSNQIATRSWLDDGKVRKKADNFEMYFIEKLKDYL